MRRSNNSPQMHQNMFSIQCGKAYECVCIKCIFGPQYISLQMFFLQMFTERYLYHFVQICPMNLIRTWRFARLHQSIHTSLLNSNLHCILEKSWNWMRLKNPSPFPFTLNFHGMIKLSCSKAKIHMEISK